MKQIELPENFDLVFDFVDNNYDALNSLSTRDKYLVLLWLHKQEEHFMRNYFLESEN